MAKMDPKQSYGVVHGHDTISCIQNGKGYDALYEEVIPVDTGSIFKVKPKPLAEGKLDAATEFLTNLLRENPLSKSAVYREADIQKKDWQAIQSAAVAMGIAKYNNNLQEMWRLPVPDAEAA